MQDFIHTVSTAPTTIPLPPTESLMVDYFDFDIPEMLRGLTHITHWLLDDYGICLDAKLSYAT
ncbi:unnamed protein product, partial [Rotaria sp. Silwood1]